MKRRLLVLGLSALLLAGCAQTLRDMNERLGQQAPSSIASSSSSSAVSSEALPEPAEATFADDVISTETGSTVALLPGTISGALLTRTAPDGVTAQGIPAAPLLTVYTHPSCAYCTDFHHEHLPRLLTEFVAQGRLRIATVIVPLTKYPASTLQAQAYDCALQEDKGDDMLVALQDAPALDQKQLTAIAKTLKLSAEFSACLTSPETAARLARQATDIAAHTITLVPAFTLNGQIQTGLPRYADLRGWIESLITRR